MVPQDANVAPLKDATMAWLSLEGIPRYQDISPNNIMERKQAQTAPFEFFPKSAREKMFSATETVIRDIIKTPKKLKIAHMVQAFFISSTPEQTAEAMTLGASVKPFTNITPKARRTGKSDEKSVKKDRKFIKISAFEQK
jgi:hypothetical protein